MLLKHLKVIFLISGMLVYNKQICAEKADDEAMIELTEYFHFIEIFFAEKKANKRNAQTVRLNYLLTA